MLVKTEDLSVVGAYPLENTVAVEEPVVEDRDLRLLFGDVSAVKVNDHGNSVVAVR